MPKAGEIIPLSVVLFDGDTTKFVRATINDSGGTPIAGSPVLLTHIAAGRYDDDSLVMPTDAFVSVVYEIFNDIFFTTASPDHSNAIDTFALEVPFADIQACLDQIKQILEDIEATGILIVGMADINAVISDATDLKAQVGDEIDVTGVVNDVDEVEGLVSDDADTIGIELGEDDLAATIKDCD